MFSVILVVQLQYVSKGARFNKIVKVFPFLLLVFFIGINTQPLLKQRMDNVFKINNQSNTSGLGLRYLDWMTGIYKASYSPVFGFGAEEYIKLYTRNDKGERKKVVQDPGTHILSWSAHMRDLESNHNVFVQPHNGYLESYIKYGLLGLIINLIIYWKSLKFTKPTKSDQDIIKAHKIFVRSFVYSILVFEMLVGLWDDPLMGFLFCIIFGSIAHLNPEKQSILNGSLSQTV